MFRLEFSHCISNLKAVLSLHSMVFRLIKIPYSVSLSRLENTHSAEVIVGDIEFVIMSSLIYYVVLGIHIEGLGRSYLNFDHRSEFKVLIFMN